MRRREFIGITAGLAAWPLIANAQQQVKKPYRIGYVALSNRTPWIDGMVDGLRELGYVEGHNLEMIWRLAAGKRDLIPEMAAELVRLNVDVIVAPSNTVPGMVKQATRTIPIVAVATHDGVGTGLYASLAHPGDNITGLESLAPELDVKRVQLLWHRSAYYIDKLLRGGAKTSELPVELPTVFDLAINLKAARLLDARIPDGLVATADLVIE